MAELNRKIDFAINLLRSIPQDGPIELCYSTGKDSDVILELAKMAGIPFKPIYKSTTCDTPGSIQHAREMGVEIVRPKKNLLALMEENGWPSRFYRFCCRELKEYKIHDRAILGIRRSESKSREKNYKEPEKCRAFPSGKVRQYYPILYWQDDDVLRFIEERGLKLNPKYYDNNGNVCVGRRVGCIGCPLASDNGIADFKKYPHWFRARVRAFQKWYDAHPDSQTVKEYPSVFHVLYLKLFCGDKEDYDLTFADNQLFPIPDPKKFLEEYFGIDLTV